VVQVIPFFSKGEATRCLILLPKTFISSWEELVEDFLERFFFPSKVMKLSTRIQNFKRMGVEHILQTWLHFNKVLLQCPYHGFLEKFLLNYFYHNLDVVNKGLADDLIHGCIVRQPFVVA